MDHLSVRLQGPKGHTVGAAGERPECGRQLVHIIHQLAVHVDVEAGGPVLEPAGLQHHVVLLAVRQPRGVGTGRVVRTVGLHVAQDNWMEKPKGNSGETGTGLEG